MKTGILRELGLSDNEIKIYLHLLKAGVVTAYDISQKTGIYRVHVYDKLEKLMDKGFVTSLYQGPKKFFQAASPEKIQHYIDEKKKRLEEQEIAVKELLPDLQAMMAAP
ncbi:MAG: helix-turn-helix domain-containing protein, partial [Nanoarchaeota archaeon]|nr:helix-turn-helix domain-containing protein [Nanoarchaeota archaeon]